MYNDSLGVQGIRPWLTCWNINWSENSSYQVLSLTIYISLLLILFAWCETKPHALYPVRPASEVFSWCFSSKKGKKIIIRKQCKKREPRLFYFPLLLFLVIWSWWWIQLARLACQPYEWSQAAFISVHQQSTPVPILHLKGHHCSSQTWQTNKWHKCFSVSKTL